MILPQIPKNWRQMLLKQSAETCKKLHIKEATLGNKILDNGAFFPDLRNGKGCHVDTYAKVIDWFLTNQSALPISQRDNNATTKLAE